MEGFYLIFVLSVWYGLTRLFKKIAYKLVARNAKKNNVNIVLRTGIFLFWILWFGLSFWYAGGRNLYYDAYVSLMCWNDGGATVYETVLVSKEKYKDVIEGIVTSEKITPTDKYHLKTEYYYYRTGQPVIERFHDKIVRISDGKILAEYVFYLRLGGNFPGPWHGSSYSCPQDVPNIISLVFLKE